MKLPDTQNAHHLYAFKKGYRLALDGKTVNQAASKIRYDLTMRQYCQMGWEQANEEMAAGINEMQKKPWRNRLAWFVMMVLGGIATATVLINNINEEKTRQQTLPSSGTPAQPVPQIQSKEASQPSQTNDTVKPKLTLGETTSPAEPASKVTEVTIAASSEPADATPKADEDLGILTPQQREDLTLTQQEQQDAVAELVDESPVINTSDITLVQSALTVNIVDKQPTEIFTGHVPANVRKLFFFTTIKDGKGKVVYHRWIHKQKVMALIPLAINSNLYRTWSSKRLADAWQGEWTVEVLNSEMQVLYRHSFTYGNI